MKESMSAHAKDDMMTPPIFFEHAPLEPNRNQFRLLKIRKPTAGGVIYELEHYSFDENDGTDVRSYVALSYLWGPEQQTHNIVINSKQYNIRQNLYDFLEEIVMEKNEQYVWIDQICINQNSAIERNHQVSLMSSIYKNASCVLVWLGQCKAELVPGLRCFQELQTPMYCDLSDFLDFRTDVAPGKANIGKWVLNGEEPKLKKEVIHAVNQIYSNPYWTRLWIVQEVLLGRNVVVQQGRYKFHLSAIGMFEKYGLRPRFGYLFHAPEVALASRQDGPAWSRPRDLLWMISEHYYFECQDPRDKVYGLLGTLEFGYTVPVDYRKSVEEVFIDAMFACLSISKARQHKSNEDERKSTQLLVQTLYNLALHMIPDGMDEFFEEQDGSGFRFRAEQLNAWWLRTGNAERQMTEGELSEARS